MGRGCWRRRRAWGRESRARQTEHYKLDWHRFNLRQRLLGAQPITVENFENIAGEVSSISGSDSEETDSDTEPERLHCRSIQNILHPEDEEPPTEEKPRGRLSHRVLFQTSEGEYLAVYRCVLQGKQDPVSEERLLSSLLHLGPQTIWVILMAGGGHFAGAVFRGSEAVLHKTFHRYTVRAKCGVAQGARDGQNRSRAPKSAGASLRRYNEAALVKEVQDLLESWSESLQLASAIFLRAPSYNKSIFFSGKPPSLNQSDERLRTIPFPTRRATFKEVKRVHGTLSTMEIYVKDMDIATIHSPERRDWKVKLKAAEEDSGSVSDDRDELTVDAADLPCSLELVEETLGTLDLREFEVSPKKKRKKKKKMDCREETKRTGAPNTPDDEMTQTESSQTAVPETEQFSTKAKDQTKKQPRNNRASPACPLEEREWYRVRNELYTGCQTGNVEQLRELLRHVLPTRVTELDLSGETNSSRQAAESVTQTHQERGTETHGLTRHDVESQSGTERHTPDKLHRLSSGSPGEDSVGTGPPGDDDSLPGLATATMLSEPLDEAGFTLLHVAAAAGQRTVLRLLMDSGCDPVIRDKRGQSAYAVSADKDTRNEFRRYMADHPGRYDYGKAQFPAPLTSEIESKKAEKKRAQKAAKKLREKEQKEEKKRKEEEEMEKKRYAAMSEREKRALAAEKRFAQQLVHSGTVHHHRRCWMCGQSLLGRVPFEYLDYTFCTTRCLQEHKKQQRL
ncbi:tRNA endonuclease ANKZF1 isoform X4 [Heptranchias perlo]|uniref:tRNA endonuclease ANKZF1 isoform X4 n=1 Tax=Heptranchias perlo TaxID=212740 RepID=UPI00355A0BD9